MQAEVDDVLLYFLHSKTRFFPPRGGSPHHLPHCLVGEGEGGTARHGRDQWATHGRKSMIAQGLGGE